jgi:hypothetical protein
MAIINDLDSFGDNLEDFIQISCIYPLFQSTRAGFDGYLYCRILCKTGLTYLTELDPQHYQSELLDYSLFNSWN